MNKKVCLITGASSGIGMNTAIKLSEIVDHIYISGRDVTRLEEVNDKIIQNGSECTIVPMDLTLVHGVKELAKNIFEKEKKIDIIVSSAGRISQLAPISSQNEEEVFKTFELNFMVNLKLMKEFLPLLRTSSKAKFIILSALSDKYKKQYWSAYQPIMAALNELIKIFAEENKSSNVKIYPLCPSAVDTNFRNEIMPGENKDQIFKPEYIAEIIRDIIETDDFKSGKIIKI